MEALSSNPIASGREVHEELSWLHLQDDDDLADVLPDPFSLPRIRLRVSEVDNGGRYYMPSKVKSSYRLLEV
jgi:hypothetical protein